MNLQRRIPAVAAAAALVLFAASGSLPGQNSKRNISDADRVAVRGDLIISSLTVDRLGLNPDGSHRVRFNVNVQFACAVLTASSGAFKVKAEYRDGLRSFSRLGEADATGISAGGASRVRPTRTVSFETAVAAGVTRTATLAVQPAAPPTPRTFGFSTLDGFAYTGHNWPLVNNEQVQPATLTEAGLLTAIRTFFWDIGNPPDSDMRVRAIFYADAGGAPGELIAVTPEVTDFVAASWRDFPLTTPVALPPGTYWIGIWGDTSQDAYSIPGVNRYKPLTYSATGAPQNPWNQDGNPGVDGAVNRPVCGVYTPLD